MSTYEGALKDDYGPGLRNALNNSNPLWTECERNDEDIVGEQAVWSVHTGRSNSTGGRAELATMPNADRQRYTKVRDDLVFNYHTIQVSGPSKHLTRNDTGSFVRVLDSEMKQGEKDIKNDRARQLFGTELTDGTNLQTGVMAVLSADPNTGQTFTIANASRSEMRYFFEGIKLRVVNPADGTLRTGTYEVTAKDVANRTLTVDTAADAGIASGDYLVRGDADGSSFGQEIHGLRHLINPTSVYAGINPSTVPTWGARQVGSTSTPISEALLAEAVGEVEDDGDGSTPSLYVVERKQRDKLANELQAKKRYDGKEVTLKAGWSGLQIAQGTLLVDRYCPTQDGFAITPKELVRFVGLDWTWDDDDGRVLFKTGTKDAVEARFKTYDNLEVTVRNAHCRILLSDPAA